MDPQRAQQIAHLHPQLDPRLRRTLARKLHRSVEHPDVQDACATAWERALRAPAAPLHDPAHLSNWLALTALRVYYAEYRHTQHEQPHPDHQLQTLTSCVAPSAEEQALHHAQLATIDQLEQRRALTIKAKAAGFSYHEIAHALNRSTTRVDHLLREGRRALNAQWDPPDQPPPGR